MAARLVALGVPAAVVCGRIRDVEEVNAILSVWARGISTVGAGGRCRAIAEGVPVQVTNVGTVNPGDVVCGSGYDGVVVVPRALLEQVVNLLLDLVEADRTVMEAVKDGMSVKEAFAAYRK